LSYDFKLFRPPEGIDPARAFRELLEREEQGIGDLEAWRARVLPDLVRQEMQNLATLVKASHPAFEQFEPVPPLPWIELTHENLDVQVTIYEDSATITIAYFRDRSDQMMACVFDCIDVFHRAAGYLAYDPQLGRIVTRANVGEILGIYRGMNDRLPEMLHPSPRKRPWWKFWSSEV